MALQIKLRVTPSRKNAPELEEQLSEKARLQGRENRTDKRCRGRPLLGENRRAPLTLYDLRQLAQLLGRVERHVPKALANDVAKHEAKVCGAIAELESRVAAPRKVREKVAYGVTKPGEATVVVYGMDALGQCVGRAASYVQNRLSRGNGVTLLQRAHPETGNPDHIRIERIGTGFAPQQESCQEPKNAVGERKDDAPSNSGDE